MSRLIAFLFFVTSIFALPTSAAEVADYRFADTLSSSIPGAPDLSPLGGGSFVDVTVSATSVRAWSFSEGTGLDLDVSGLLGSSEYTVVMLFEAQEVYDYAKLLDTQDRIIDEGLYYEDNDIYFYDEDYGTGDVISSGTYHQIVVTRDIAGNYTGYVDGAQQFSFVDSSDYAVISGANRLVFFRDDSSTTDENTAGTVVRIRIFDNALTGGEVAALTGLPAAQAAPTAAPVPTLSEWALIVLAMLLTGIVFVRRKQLS